MLNLAGKDLPSYVKVSQIRISMLPPVSQTTVTIPSRPGSYDFGNTLGDRKIEADLGFISVDKADYMKRARQLGEWLYYEDAQPLIMSSEPTKQYYSKFTGDSNLSELAKIGKGTITFICTDPFVYSTVEKTLPFAPTDTVPAVVENEGNEETEPIISLEFTQSTTEFALTTDNQEKFIYLGQPAPVDTTTPVPQRSRVLYDDGSSVALWTSGVGVDGGTIVGSLQSTGSYIRQADNNYGSGSTWHGAAGVRSINKQIQDFTVEALVGFKSKDPKQVQRLEIYLLDASNVRIGKVALRDSAPSSISTFLEARAGQASGGNQFVNTEVGKGYYVDFYGKLTIQRIGQWWYFGIGKRDTKGNYFGRWSTKYFDKNNQYQTKLAGIQIHFAAYASNPAYPTVYIDELSVYEENSIDPNTQVPYIFNPGDKLEINCRTGDIRKNGTTYYDSFNPYSTFLKLQPGANNFYVSPPEITNGQIVYRERWR